MTGSKRKSIMSQEKLNDRQRRNNLRWLLAQITLWKTKTIKKDVSVLEKREGYDGRIFFFNFSTNWVR